MLRHTSQRLLAMMLVLLGLWGFLCVDTATWAATVDLAPRATDPPVLVQAKRLIDKGEAESAVTILRRYLATAPKADYLDDTYLLLGAALFEMKDYVETLKVLRQLQTELPASEVIDRGKILEAHTHAAMGNPDLALPLLAQVRTRQTD